jgi:hypothetical protein
MCETGEISTYVLAFLQEISIVIHHKKSRRHKKDKLLNLENIYKWTLYKYIGLQD